MKTVIKYMVTAEDNSDPNPSFRIYHESPLMDSKEECEQWINENLPVSVQKCRTGTYEIVEIPSV